MRQNQGQRFYDALLTNKPKHLHHTGAIETGLSDCHKVAVFFFKALHKKLPHKIIEYRNYEKFNEKRFYTN